MMYLITKQINNNVVDLLRQPIPRFLAVSITGLGGTIIEPNVPKYEETFDRLEKLIDSGFDVNDLVIRIDPLYPGINTPDVNKKLLVDIIERTYKLGVKQIYTSIFDIYKNTPQSMLDELDMSVYDNGFAVDNVLHANKHYLKEMFSVVDELIYKVSNGSIKHSLCGEHGDVIPKYAIKIGCLNKERIEQTLQCKVKNIKDRKYDDKNIQRETCLCVITDDNKKVKRQALTHNHKCNHKCLGCYIQ